MNESRRRFEEWFMKAECYQSLPGATAIFKMCRAGQNDSDYYHDAAHHSWLSWQEAERQTEAACKQRLLDSYKQAEK